MVENGKKIVLLLNDNKNNNYTLEKWLLERGDDGNYVALIADNQINADSKILTKAVFDVVN